MRREIEPLLGSLVRLVYNPSFIAMGTTIRDFIKPEFVLIGGDDGTVEHIYREMGIGPVRHMSIESAELAKVAYNVAIGQKIVLANAVMEICHKTEADCDEVSGALEAATRRVASGAYLRGGMGDGGACHPRDQIALSWLARSLDLSCDPFEAAMVFRQDQTAWLCDLMEEYELPKGIIGFAYKPRSHLDDGSPALLAANILRERGHYVTLVDPYVCPPGVASLTVPLSVPAVYLHGCDHGGYPELPEGSVVIDPWRTWPDQDGVEVVKVGQAVRNLARV
jgi:UDPglucose 6-dehydrogenase